nr:hypothetical protein [Thiocystis violascens]
MREFRAGVSAQVQQVERLEGAVLGLVEDDQNHQDFAECQPAGALPTPLSLGEELAVPVRQKLLAEIIHITEHCFKIDHGGARGAGWHPDTLAGLPPGAAALIQNSR